MPATSTHLTFAIGGIKRTLECHLRRDRVHHHDARDVEVEQMTAKDLGTEFDRQVAQAPIEARYGILHVVEQLIFVVSTRRIFRVQIRNAIAEDAAPDLRISLQAIVLYSPRVE